MTYLDTFLRHDKKTILKNIKNLKPLSYNRFYWWRLFKDNDTLTNSKSTVLERIQNNEYEFSPYYWQAQYAILNGIDKVKNIKNIDDQFEKSSIDLERYRKLMVDFEKDEQKRLDTVIKKLSKHFKITYQEVLNEIDNFDGTLEELFYYLRKKY